MEIKEQKEKDLHKDLEKIIENLREVSKTEVRLDKVELQIFHNLVNLGLSLLKYYIYLMSQKLELCSRVPKDSQGKKMKNIGKTTRVYRSVFGKLEIQRYKYYSKTDKVYYRLDKSLCLPTTSYSYLLQDWLAYGATQMSFEESVSLLERVLNQNLESTQSSRCTYELSKEVENYYDQKDWSDQQEGTHLCIGADGKGVPIVNIDRGEKTKNTTASRLGKGKRGGIKKEATVTVSSSFTPRSRNADQIIDRLFKKQNEQHPSSTDNKLHHNKHLRAFVANKTKALEYGIQNLLDRAPQANKPIIALMDGEPVLRKQIRAIIQKKGMEHRLECCILDFIHVLEKVWQVANAYKGEKAPDRQDWVEQQARLLLNSQTQQVIDQWKKLQHNTKYSKTQAKHIEDGIRYFEKRLDMMDYKTFLAKGYPITTGVIESACGHFVKNRMERNGMRWTLNGAQNMLDIRAVMKNNHWQDYINDYINRHQTRIYNKAA